MANYSPIIAPCQVCGNEFITRPKWYSPRKFCSVACRNKGRKHWNLSPEARENIRRGTNKRFEDPIERAKHGHTWTDEYRERFRKERTGKTLRLSPEARAKLAEAARARFWVRWANPEKRAQILANLKKGAEKAHASGAILAARLRRIMPREGTKIENSLEKAFKAKGLEFEMHKTMFGRFQPDFTFEQAQLFVQADGEYWHGLPRNKRCDAAFNKAARLAGWAVFRFSGTQIKADPIACASAVEAFIRKHI